MLFIEIEELDEEFENIKLLFFFPETLSFPSLELVRTCPSKIKLSEDSEVNPLISYTPWTKA